MSDQAKKLFDTLRLINNDDYYKNYEKLFSTLSKCHSLSKEEFEDVIVERTKQGWITWVLEDTIEQDNKQQTLLIATLSIMFERKFYREGKKVAHIEDVIVLPEYQHHKLGTALNNYAIEYANQHGCYKVILDCKPELENFYNLAGMQKSNIQMAQYF